MLTAEDDRRQEAHVLHHPQTHPVCFFSPCLSLFLVHSHTHTDTYSLTHTPAHIECTWMQGERVKPPDVLKPYEAADKVKRAYLQVSPTIFGITTLSFAISLTTRSLWVCRHICRYLFRHFVLHLSLSLCLAPLAISLASISFGALALCCNVMQCVQRVKVCCIVLECVAVRYSVLQFITCRQLQIRLSFRAVAVRCSVLQCVAVRCRALQCVAEISSMLLCNYRDISDILDIAVIQYASASERWTPCRR